MRQVYVNKGQFVRSTSVPVKDDDMKGSIWFHMANDVVFSVTINLH